MNKKTTINIIEFKALLQKYTRLWLPIVLLFCSNIIYGCGSTDATNLAEQVKPKSNSCPQSSKELSYVTTDREDYDFYEIFNYQTNNIIANRDTIYFESLDRKFIFCRVNKTWSIETINKPKYPDKSLSESNQIVEIQGKKYQYGVKIAPNSSGVSERVIFELVTAESNLVQRQLLYDLEQTKQAGAGVELGDPEISPPVVHGDRVFWSIFTYRGEGFGGIATIVSYDPTTSKITVIQPPEIATQILNDLTISGTPKNPTFWLATQLTGEGNPYIPSMGLVAYRPSNADYTQGEIASYRVDNSLMVGAIPTKLFLEKNILWVGTGNGICQIEWQTISDRQSWNCWRFAVMANLPEAGIPVYSSLLDTTVETTLSVREKNQDVEILWWLPQQREPLKGRYEIQYEGREIEFNDIGAITWKEYYYEDMKPPIWKAPLYWVGDSWHWDGHKFVRGLDEVELNLVGGGAIGIHLGQPNKDYVFDTKAMRGDIELLELDKSSTKLKYYSAWVDDNLLKPYLTIVPTRDTPSDRPNPLSAIKSQLLIQLEDYLSYPSSSIALCFCQ